MENTWKVQTINPSKKQNYIKNYESLKCIWNIIMLLMCHQLPFLFSQTKQNNYVDIKKVCLYYLSNGAIIINPSCCPLHLCSLITFELKF